MYFCQHCVGLVFGWTILVENKKSSLHTLQWHAQIGSVFTSQWTMLSLISSVPWNASFMWRHLYGLSLWWVGHDTISSSGWTWKCSCVCICKQTVADFPENHQLTAALLADWINWTQFSFGALRICRLCSQGQQCWRGYIRYSARPAFQVTMMSYFWCQYKRLNWNLLRYATR